MKGLLLFVIFCLIKTSYTLTNCKTPNGEEAVCKPIKQCKVFLEVLKDGVRPPESIMDFMRKSNCGFDDGQPLVCCGSFNHSRELTPPTSNPRKHKNFHLLPTHCGIQDVDEKIPGGAVAQLEEFPWMGLLEFNFDGNREFLCGASLISSQYALTVAHCGINRQGRPFSIRFGEHDLDTEIDCGKKFEANQYYEVCIESYLDVDIERIIIHPGYNVRAKSHDIALIRLAKPVEIRTNIRPICLPLDREEYPPGTRMSVAGWGATEFQHKSNTNVKLKASLPIVSQQKCKDFYMRRSRNNISEEQICAGGEVGVDTCQGDSGNALVIPKEGSLPTQWKIEGIVSFGVACGLADVPGVFTRVSSYVNWILDHME